jgi:Tol biopolymer transport system component
VTVICVVVAFAVAPPSVSAATATTSRISVDTAGSEGNAESYGAAISADGRFVAFGSAASNLIAGDTNGAWDVFVRDRLLGTTARVSVSSAEVQGNHGSDSPSISADGRFVAFVSAARNLTQNDTNGWADIFVRDRTRGTTQRVSVSSKGRQANRRSYGPSISANGRFVAYESAASTLVRGTVLHSKVFVRDRARGRTELVSVSSSEALGHGEGWGASVSANGRFVAFQSDANDLVPHDTNEYLVDCSSGECYWYDASDVFVRDRQRGTTRRISVTSAERQANENSYDPAISADGRFVAFGSTASNLVAGDTNGKDDAFVRDRANGTTRRVSVSSSETQGSSNSFEVSISAGGRFVVFASESANLIPSDINGVGDVFVRDRRRGTTQRVSVGAAGEESNGSSYPGAFSANGRFLLLFSSASNLVAGDLNGVDDVFVRGPLL